MDPYGYSTAVDICHHDDGYLIRWGAIECGTCRSRFSLPNTWAVRGTVSSGVVLPAFGSFTTAVANTTNSMGMFSNQWRRATTNVQIISEEITKNMHEEWFKGVHPLLISVD